MQKNILVFLLKLGHIIQKLEDSVILLCWKG